MKNEHQIEPEALHLMSEIELSDKKVSPQSRWNDSRWVFENPTAGQQPQKSTISWDFTLFDGSNFLDSQWNELRQIAKRFAWSMFFEYNGGKPLKPGSALPLSIGIRALMNFMASNSYSSFGDLNANALDDYKDYVANIVYGYEYNPTPKQVTPSAFTPYLQIISFIYKQTSILKFAGITPLPTRPWDGASIEKLTVALSNKDPGTIPPIPDDAFCIACNSALDIIKDADTIIDDAAILYEHYKDFKHTQKHELTSLIAIKSRISLLTDACFVIIQACSGIRTSEMCGLKINANDKCTKWPSYINVRQSQSGLHEVFLMCGDLFKTTDSLIHVEWTLGIRPIGSDHIPLPVQALIILERLYRPWRASQKIDTLCVLFPSLPSYYNVISLSGQTLASPHFSYSDK